MATAKVTKKVIVPAVEEVSEKRIVLELSENEAKAILLLTGAVASGHCGDLDTSDVYRALHDTFGGMYSSHFGQVFYKDIAGDFRRLSGALKLVPRG